MTDVPALGLRFPLFMRVVSLLVLYWAIRKAVAAGIEDYAQKHGDRMGIGRPWTNPLLSLWTAIRDRLTSSA